MKTFNKKYLIALTLLIAIVVVGFGAFKARANPSVLPPAVQTSSATTSPVFIGTGTATSTLVYDAYLNGTPTKATAASVLVQFAASSTSSVLNMSVEYAYGSTQGSCATVATMANCDWYADNTASLSTSTGLTTLNTANSFQWTFASSTRGGAGVTNANSATSTKLFTIQTPVRYTRVIFSVTGAPTALWAQISPIKEVGNVQ